MIEAEERFDERVSRLREDHIRWMGRQEAGRLVFIDETGCNCAMARHHARAPAGTRAMDRLPRNRGGPITIIGALRSDGLTAVMTVEGGTDTLVFQAYVDHVLVPELRPADIVVMDNLAAHKADGVRASIEAAGCSLVLQPPYSPDLNPIELAWSKLKSYLRTARARTREALDVAVKWAMDTVSSRDAMGWFRHSHVLPQAA